MKALKIILIVLATIIALSLATFGYYGGFSKIEFRTELAGGEIIVYEELTGDYKQAAEVSDRVYNMLKNDFGIETTRGFGIYYDNPEKVANDKMRSDVGCVLDSQPDSVTLAKLEGKFKVRQLPVKECVITDFPFKSAASIVMGIIKVYPAMNEYMDINNLEEGKAPIMEIYNVPEKKITYRTEAIKEID